MLCASSDSHVGPQEARVHMEHSCSADKSTIESHMVIRRRTSPWLIGNLQQMHCSRGRPPPSPATRAIEPQHCKRNMHSTFCLTFADGPKASHRAVLATLPMEPTSCLVANRYSDHVTLIPCHKENVYDHRSFVTGLNAIMSVTGPQRPRHLSLGSKDQIVDLEQP